MTYSSQNKSAVTSSTPSNHFEKGLPIHPKPLQDGSVFSTCNHGFQQCMRLCICAVQSYRSEQVSTDCAL